MRMFRCLSALQALGIEQFKMMALWSRTRAEATSGQTPGEEPRLPHIGPRATDPDDHAVKREEDEPEGCFMDSEESRSRTRAGTYSRPSLGEEPRAMLTVQGTRIDSTHSDFDSTHSGKSVWMTDQMETMQDWFT